MRKMLLCIAGAMQVIGAIAGCYVVLVLTQGLQQGQADRAAVLGFGGIIMLLVGQGVADVYR